MWINVYCKCGAVLNATLKDGRYYTQSKCKGCSQAKGQPVSVSLEKCAKALQEQIPGSGKFEDWWYGAQADFGRDFLGKMAKSVLDEAGVKYHED